MSIVATTIWIVTITVVSVTSEIVTPTIRVCCGYINKTFCWCNKKSFSRWRLFLQKSNVGYVRSDALYLALLSWVTKRGTPEILNAALEIHCVPLKTVIIPIMISLNYVLQPSRPFCFLRYFCSFSSHALIPSFKQAYGSQHQQSTFRFSCLTKQCAEKELNFFTANYC